ncbi:MAG: methylated-DNA--[protein]-cysteine S-methyltransferase [Deltaproteobacteria bacterium]
MKGIGGDSIKYKSLSFETPLGMMTALSEPRGIISLFFSDSPCAAILSYNPDYVSDAVDDEHLNLLKKEIQEYFAGELKKFTVKICLRGTDFQKKVWTELMKIPYGSTRTYKQQAIELNDLKAIRAIASANGKNNINIIVPCHRIIGSDGSLTGFAGGLWRKKWLLEHEKNIKDPGLFPEYKL